MISLIIVSAKVNQCNTFTAVSKRAYFQPASLFVHLWLFHVNDLRFDCLDGGNVVANH